MGIFYSMSDVMPMPCFQYYSDCITHNFFTLIITGKWTNHKGRNRRFTNPEELEEERKREEERKQWRVRELF